MEELTIDVVSDVVCPWCFIGAHRLDRVIESLRAEAPELTVTVRHHPFELMPHTPPSGLNVADMLRKKYGVDPKTLWARVESAACESGLCLELSKQEMAYPTLRAHTLIRMAETPAQEHALALALFEAYFRDARDVSDPALLAAIGAQHGLSEDRVIATVGDAQALEHTREAAQEWLQRGVTGVPFFVVGERFAFSGAQPEELFRKVIAKARAERASPTSRIEA